MTKNKADYEADRLMQLPDEVFAGVMAKITEKAVKTEVRPKDQLVHITELAEDIHKEHQSWGRVNGLSTGYKALDDKIGGMGKGHVILIGGETSNGKSALAANIARNVAKRNGVLFITLEMLQAEIGSRFMHINEGTIDDLDIMFQLEHRLEYKDIKPLMDRAVKTGDIKLVVLDYLQYLGRGMTNDEVAKMSKEMKNLALEFQVPFIVIVSLRKGDNQFKRKWKDIEIEEFMGTGAIGYDADTAMITSRKDPEGNYQEDKLFVKVLKTRNTQLQYDDRIIEFLWDKTRIKEYDPDFIKTIQEIQEKG